MDRRTEETVLRIARVVRAKFPRGSNEHCCFKASSDIVERMKDHPFECSIQFGWIGATNDRSFGNTHCWVEVWTRGMPHSDRRILDVTIDQFGDQWPEILWAKAEKCPQYHYDMGDPNVSGC